MRFGVSEILISTAATVASVVASVAALAYWLGRKFATIDMKFREMDNRFREVENKFNAKFDEVNRRIDKLAEGVASAVTNVQGLVLEYMGLKGLFTRDEVKFLMKGVAALTSSAVANPITKEELDYIRSVMSKDIDEVTVEELEKVLEIAKRWYKEDFSELAYRVFFAAAAARSYKIYQEKREGAQQK
ncbi:MAG: hypothetical protein QW247_09450 [Pyrobaculum sp.]